MGFNEITLLELIFGLLIPLAVIIFFLLSKNRGNIAYNSIGYGFVSFLASIIIVFIIFTIANMLFLSSLEFGEDTSGGCGRYYYLRDNSHTFCRMRDL